MKINLLLATIFVPKNDLQLHLASSVVKEVPGFDAYITEGGAATAAGRHEFTLCQAELPASAEYHSLA